jgi:hypothetical protein
VKRYLAALALAFLATTAHARDDVQQPFLGGTGCESPDTVAGLPSGGTIETGTICTVSDGADGTDCTTGLGSSKVLCMYDGSAWVEVGSSAASICSGTTTYLDGEGNCDTLDEMTDFSPGAPISANTFLVSNSSGDLEYTATLGGCGATGGQHLTYDNSTRDFGCSTDIRMRSVVASWPITEGTMTWDSVNDEMHVGTASSTVILLDSTTASTTYVALDGSTDPMTGGLTIDGAADEIQLDVEAAAGQTANNAEFCDSTGVKCLTIDADGDLTITDAVPIITQDMVGNTAGLNFISFLEDGGAAGAFGYRGSTNATRPNSFQVGCNTASCDTVVTRGAGNVAVTCDGGTGVCNFENGVDIDLAADGAAAFTVTGTTGDWCRVFQGASATYYQCEATASGDWQFATRVAGDTNNRLQITAAGQMSWGAGGASVVDTILSRTAADTLELAAGDTLSIAGDFTCTDCLNATEIEDIYVLLAGDFMSGALHVEESDGTALIRVKETATGAGVLSAQTNDASTGDPYLQLTTDVDGTPQHFSIGIDNSSDDLEINASSSPGVAIWTLENGGDITHEGAYQHNGRVDIDTSGATGLQVEVTGATTAIIRDTDAADGTSIQFWNDNDGVDGAFSDMSWWFDDDLGTLRQSVILRARMTDTDGTGPADLVDGQLDVIVDNDGTPTRMQIWQSNASSVMAVVVNPDNRDIDFTVNSDDGTDLIDTDAIENTVAIGQGATTGDLLFLNGMTAADEVLRIQGHASQADNIFTVESSEGTNYWGVDLDGDLVQTDRNTRLFLADDGTASLPTLSFNGDANTGIYQTSPNENEFHITAAGVKVATFAADGTGGIEFINDADAAVVDVINLYGANRATPTDADSASIVFWQEHDGSVTSQAYHKYFEIASRAQDVTEDAEDTQVEFLIQVEGVEQEILTLISFAGSATSIFEVNPGEVDTDFIVNSNNEAGLFNVDGSTDAINMYESGASYIQFVSGWLELNVDSFGIRAQDDQDDNLLLLDDAAGKADNSVALTSVNHLTLAVDANGNDTGSFYIVDNDVPSGTEANVLVLNQNVSTDQFDFELHKHDGNGIEVESGTYPRECKTFYAGAELYPSGSANDPAEATEHFGTAAWGTKYLAFDPNTDERASATWVLPSNYRDTDLDKVKVFGKCLTGGTCANDGSSDSCWFIDVDSRFSGQAANVALGGVNNETVIRGEAAGDLMISDGVTITNDNVAGEIFRLRLQRDTDGATCEANCVGAGDPYTCCSGAGAGDCDNLAEDFHVIAVQYCYGVQNVFTGEQ